MKQQHAEKGFKGITGSLTLKFIVVIVIAQLITPFLAGFINQQIERMGVANIGIITMITSFTNLIILTIFMTFAIKWIILNRVSALQKFANNVANGDLRERLDITKEDEIASLGRGINDMVDSLSEMVRQSTVSSEQMEAASQELSSNTELISRTMEGIKDRTDNIEREVGNTMQAVEKASQDSELLKNRSEKIMASSERILERSEDARVLAEEGQNAAQGVEDRIHNTTASFERLAKTTEVLQEYSEKITLVTETIQKISQQTGILAINAKIESARAGEAGKGFAVVADEVNSLAEETGSSVEAIEKTMEALKTGIMELGNEMKEASETLGEIRDASDRTKQTLTGIVGQIENVDHRIHDINEINQEQADFSQEFGHLIYQITNKTESINESVQATNELVETTSGTLIGINKSTDGMTAQATATKEKLMKIKI